MNNKTFFTIICGLFVGAIGALIFFYFIGVENNKPNDDNDKGNVTYRIINEGNRQYLDYTKRGYFFDTLNSPNAPYYYIITMGECPTGGFSISVDNIIVDKDNNVKIIVKEEKPKIGETNIQVLTYPSVTVELSNNANTVQIVDTEGNKYQRLN